MLFWSSVVWRISINEKNGVKLSKNQNEKLRRILDSNLKEDTNPDYSELKGSSEVKRISYRLLRCPNYSDTHTTHMLWHPKFKHPYSLILDEYVLLFAFKDNYNDYQRMDLFGIQQEALDAPINKFNDEEKILPLSEQTMSTVNYSVIEEVMKVRAKRLNEFLDGVHQRFGGRGKVMPAHLKQEIFEEITSDEKKMGRKHNLEDITRSAYKVLKKYAP